MAPEFYLHIASEPHRSGLQDCFGQGREEFAIQTLVAKLVVKAARPLFRGQATTSL